MKKLLFIFNPSAGKGRVRTKIAEIVEYYKSQGYLTTIYPTSEKGDGFNFIRDLKEEYDLIVCSGGDGTLNEVVSGILDAQIHTSLGYIPSGSTNDFARSVKIPVTINEAMKILCGGIPYELDIGRLNERYFVYVAGFGAFTKVSYATPQKMKNALGYLAYLLQGIKELSELKAYFATISCDGKNVSGYYIVGLIMNSFSIGGFRNPTSKLTDLNDGIFEVLLIRMPQNLIELQGIVAALLGDLNEAKSIEYFQASRIQITSESMEWTVDGEYGGKYEGVVVENINRAISILTRI